MLRLTNPILYLLITKCDNLEIYLHKFRIYLSRTRKFIIQTGDLSHVLSRPVTFFDFPSYATSHLSVLSN